MATAVRMHVSERGGTPERATLVAFGGAGPMHADNLARKLSIRRIVVPLRAGVLSALGLLVAPAAFDLVRTVKTPLTRFDAADAEVVFAELTAEIEATLRQVDPEARIEYSRAADVGYIGQGYQVTVPLPDGGLDPDTLWDRFAQIYAEKYGYFYDDVAAEVVDLRLNGRLIDGALQLRPMEPTDARAVAKGERRAYSHLRRERIAFRVFDRDALAPGMSFDGPAILEESSTTTVVDIGARVAVDDFGSLVIEIGAEGLGR